MTLMQISYGQTLFGSLHAVLVVMTTPAVHVVLSQWLTREWVRELDDKDKQESLYSTAMAWLLCILATIIRRVTKSKRAHEIVTESLYARAESSRIRHILNSYLPTCFYPSQKTDSCGIWLDGHRDLLDNNDMKSVVRDALDRTSEPDQLIRQHDRGSVIVLTISRPGELTGSSVVELMDYVVTSILCAAQEHHVHPVQVTDENIVLVESFSVDPVVCMY